MTFTLSTLFGFFALLKIVEFIILKLKFNAFRASYISRTTARKKRKAFENSSAYSTRLAEVLKLIKEESATDNRSIKISYIDGCETDHEIKRELGRRGFDTYTGNEMNTLQISW